jgi:hypothetical protein
MHSHCTHLHTFGGIAGETSFKLAFGLDTADRHYPIRGSWASIEVGVVAPEGDSIFLVTTVENDLRLCTLDGFRMTNQLPVMLPSGEEFVALDLNTDHAGFKPILMMDI